MRNGLLVACLPALGFAASSCLQDNLTYEEALEALEEAAVSAKGEAMTMGIIEISTEFTMGDAVEAAAQELYDFLVSQIDCSEVSLDGNTVTVDFGTLDDACVYSGYTYAGLWAITIESNDADGVQVTHQWTGLTNGDLSLDGSADVDWSAGATSRHVVHEVSWTDAEHSLVASGDRTQSLLDPADGLDAGIVVDGSRQWTSETGDWLLDIDQVEMRGQDPVPQSGVYSLTTPVDKVLTLTFERLDDDTIKCTLEGTRRTWVFEVTSAGVVEDAYRL